MNDVEEMIRLTTCFQHINCKESKYISSFVFSDSIPLFEYEERR